MIKIDISNVMNIFIMYITLHSNMNTRKRSSMSANTMTPKKTTAKQQKLYSEKMVELYRDLVLGGYDENAQNDIIHNICEYLEDCNLNMFIERLDELAAVAIIHEGFFENIQMYAYGRIIHHPTDNTMI